jgi:hypothetical protein
VTRRKREIPLLGAINPDQLYRTTLAPAIFNLGWQACKNKIKSGDLPRPSPLTPGSKYEAWTGQQILDHRKDMQALAEQKAPVDAARPKQEQPVGFKRAAKAAPATKIKKTKLRTDQTLKKRA